MNLKCGAGAGVSGRLGTPSWDPSETQGSSRPPFNRLHRMGKNQWISLWITRWITFPQLRPHHWIFGLALWLGRPTGPDQTRAWSYRPLLLLFHVKQKPPFFTPSLGH